MPDLVRVVTVGSAVVDRHYSVTNLPGPDSGAFVLDESESAGGVAANVATGLANLGHDAGVIARLGDDPDGDRVVSDLESRGIDTGRVRQVPEETSSYCLVLRDPDGERTIVAGGDSVTRLRIREADAPALAAADVVFTSAYAPAEVLESLAASRREGRIRTLAFDLSGVFAELEGRGVTRDVLDNALSAIDLFVTSELALSSYLRTDDLDAAVGELRSRGVERGAVTRGEDGAVLFDLDGVSEVPAFDVDVVDTTGAGDAFSAGLIHAWLVDGNDCVAAGRYAAATAALNCAAVGARGNLPARDAVRSFLDAA